MVDVKPKVPPPRIAFLMFFPPSLDSYFPLEFQGEPKGIGFSLWSVYSLSASFHSSGGGMSFLLLKSIMPAFSVAVA